VRRAPLQTVDRTLAHELIDFGAAGYGTDAGFADVQLDGTVALYNMLARNRCAYLADEVGMGKTYVALGVMALLRYFDPHARVVVIAPRENIQKKWDKELRNFVRTNWQRAGNRVKSIQGGPAWDPVICGNLLNFVQEALLNPDRDFLLRMTSFSLALRDPTARRKLRRGLRTHVPWLESHGLRAHSPEAFRDEFGCALNAAIPEIDLLIVDEGHNLKHGFSAKGSTRNRIMGFALGHNEGKTEEHPWFKARVKHLLLLSATPFEEDYAALQRQLEVLGFGDAKLRDPSGKDPLPVRDLLDLNVPEVAKREIVNRLMVRRVSGLRIGDDTWTKNMYRREWRSGGLSVHDEPIRIEDPKQRLIVGLMQKKVAEVLRDERFNNHFQIGMLSSFESFLESVATAKKRKEAETPESEFDKSDTQFSGEQEATEEERHGIDTQAIGQVADSYRQKFGERLPHPKLDTTAQSLASCFETGEKSLVFVRRVRTVDELAAKLDVSFDRWLKAYMLERLPRLSNELEDLFTQYNRERARRPDEQLEEQPVDDEEDDEEEDERERSEHRSYVDEEDEGSSETFFAWFFRGKGPPKCLSGAAFQKNRFSSIGSAYSTFFEEDYVSWILGRQPDPLDALKRLIGRDTFEELPARAYGVLRARTKQVDKYPRLYAYESYQIAALEILAELKGDLGEKARIILDERFPRPASTPTRPPSGFPGSDVGIGIRTFITELVSLPELRERLWPREQLENFRHRFRRREQRRELLSAMARLGRSFIDLYLLAIGNLGSFQLRGETAVEEPAAALASDFVALLDRQRATNQESAFTELSRAAETFDLLIAVNFHRIPTVPLSECATIYGATLQRQVPVGQMAGGVNKRLVGQFRMPGFPYALISTDVLQEGEDLHTFCRRVIHYGITWTPSAMEQRTGRIDRVGSLTQRRLDGCKETPKANDLIQVHYPHLQDTVEVLQVRRVLRRLNRFLRLIHKTRPEPEQNDSRIDTTRDFLEDLEQIDQIREPLESAFPIDQNWLTGELSTDIIPVNDIASYEDHLDRLFGILTDRLDIKEFRSPERRTRHGALILLEERAAQPFNLELRSQAAGDATLVRCRSTIGEIDLRDDAHLDRLYNLQKTHGFAKICVAPDVKHHEDLVYIESQIMFHPDTTQIEELQRLVSQTATAAVRIHSALQSDAAKDSTNASQISWGLNSLSERIPKLIESRKLPWSLDSDKIDVEVTRSGRRHRVAIGQWSQNYVFVSVVTGSKHVTQTHTYWRKLAYRAWRRNAFNELVTFAFDEKDRLIGLIEQPIATLDDDELALYIETVAKECDRFEYVLTGEDNE